jgi:hypothetical protein
LTYCHDLDTRVERNRGVGDPLASATHPQVLETIGPALKIHPFARRHALCCVQAIMARRIEVERPSEWLRTLDEEPDAYEVLVTEAGGLARAAYRLASARCRAHSGSGATPTLRELQVAALLIAQRLGMPETLPITSLLAKDCEAQGLPVIRPMPMPPSGRRSSVPAMRRAS